MTDLGNTIPDYFERVTRNSWTWERLTHEEQERFLQVDFSTIRGNRHQRIEAFNTAYKAFLLALGYSPSNWREPATGEHVPF